MMMRSPWNAMLGKSHARPRVMVNIQPLPPALHVIRRIDDSRKNLWGGRVGVMIDMHTLSYYQDSAGPEPREHSHPIKLRNCSAIAKEHGANVLCARQIEK